MTEALWGVVGAVVGALAATWSSNWLGRPKPALAVDAIQVTSDYLRSEPNVPLDHDLIGRCDDYPLDLGDLNMSRAVTEAAYVVFLSQAQERLRDFLTLRAPRILEVGQDFRVLVATDDFERADELFARHQEVLWPTLEAANLRHPVLLRPESDYSNLPTVHEVVVEESEGNFYIALTGPRNLGFIWSVRKGGQRETSRKLAERCAQAFAHRAKEDLLDIADYLRTYVQGLVTEGELLAGRIDGALSPYRRLLVTGIVANRGGAAFSLANRAKVVVRMKGYPRSGVNGVDPGLVDDEVDLALRIGASAESLTDPLVVQGGTAIKFIGLSDEVLSALTFGPEVVDAFQNSDRKFYLVVSAILPDRVSSVPIYSGDLLFRDIAAHPALPRR